MEGERERERCLVDSSKIEQREREGEREFGRTERPL
jgi:hypothetical protein